MSNEALGVNSRQKAACDRPGSTVHLRRRSSEGGFVLLSLLFFAAAVAFTLAIALPRSAMQSQRTREETLIYRGEQYKRAVQLYFRKYKKYPESLDDLEESDGIRFLRRRYKDPLTGEDQWRLVHMGSDGRFKDSLLFDLEEEEGTNARAGGQAGAMQSAVSALAGTFQSAPGTFRGADRARATRESASPDIPGQISNADYMAAGLTGEVPPDGVAAGGSETQPPSSDGAIPYPNYSRTLPSQIPSPTGAGALVNPALAGSPYPGMPGVYPAQPGLPTNQQSSNRRSAGQPRGNTGMNPGGITAIAPQPGAPANVPPPGFGAAGVGGSAADLIRNLLTTPRPGGLAGLRGAQGAAQQNRPNFSEGIAGVASKVEERGIKVYNEQEFYNQWEFVYDYRQDTSLAGIPGAGGPGPVGNLNPAQPGLGPGGTIQIDPSQTVPVPGMPGFPGMMPGAEQPAAGGSAFPQQPAPPPPLPGTSPFEPAPGVYPYGQPPGQPGASPYARPTPADRNSRRRRNLPPPLPGQPIYPGGANPNQPILTPGDPSPSDVPTQPPL